MWRLLADLTALLHLLFVLFVLFGGLMVLRSPRVVWAHLPAVCWGIWIELSGGYCPLTPLENRFRLLAGELGYRTGFVEHYILPILYPDWLSLPVQYVLAAVVFLLNAAVYGMIAWQRRHGRGA